jgi:hypothetical protein
VKKLEVENLVSDSLYDFSIEDSLQHPSPDQVYDPVFEFWIPGVLLNGVGILGLVGNTVSIFVLSR